MNLKEKSPKNKGIRISPDPFKHISSNIGGNAMGSTKFIILYLKKVFILLTGFLLCIFLFHSCVSSKPRAGVSQYLFTYDDEGYRIRSISSSDKTKSYNELIGKNFVAADIDQDRFIDQISLGEISLSEAQKIYNYGLTMLSKESKLVEIGPRVNQYLHENLKFDYEIKSFRPVNADPFNEFKIINKHSISKEVAILIDQKANGILNAVITGSVTVEEVQSKYSEVLKAGLEKGKLNKVDDKILVIEE